MNPYRNAFYSRQIEWHGNHDRQTLLANHELRSNYYKWYTQNWLPKDKSYPVLDIGCGSGQFVYFLKKEGYQVTKCLGLGVPQYWSPVIWAVAEKTA